MTDRELKRLSRSDLLEILIAQMEENETLKAQLQTAQEQAESRRIAIDEAGSIAEAALRLNGVFDAAQAAAAQYLANVQRLSAGRKAAPLQPDETLQQSPDETLPAQQTPPSAQDEAYSQKLRDDAAAYNKQVRADADRYSAQVRAQADAYSRRVRHAAEVYLRQMLQKAGAALRSQNGSIPGGEDHEA